MRNLVIESLPCKNNPNSCSVINAWDEKLNKNPGLNDPRNKGPRYNADGFSDNVYKIPDVEYNLEAFVFYYLCCF